MNAKPPSLRALKLLLAIWWWGSIAGTVAVAIFIFVAPSKMGEIAIWGYASDIDTSGLSAVDRNGQKLGLSFDSPTRIKFVLPSNEGDDRAVLWKRLSGLVVLPYFLLCIYFVKQLRDIVRTIDQQNPFMAENAGRIRVVGILIFLFVGLECVGRFAISGYADATVIAQGFNLDGRIKINGSLVVVGIAMLVLSEVFRHGSDMREENSLTV